MWNTLRTRLTVILIGLAIGPLLIAGAILAQRSFALEQDRAYALQNQVAQNVATELEAYFQGLATDITNTGNELRNLENPDKAQQLGILLNALNSGIYRNNYEEFALLDSTGREQVRLSSSEIVPGDQLIDRSTADEFTQPKLSREIFFSPVFFDKNTGTPYVNIAIPLFKPRSVELNNVLVAKIRFALAGSLIADARVGADQTIYITNLGGNLVAHQSRAIDLITSKISPQDQAGSQPGLDGTSVILASHEIRLGQQPLKIIAEKPTSKALELGIITITTIVIIILVSLAIAVFLGFLTVRSIVQPIEGLAKTAGLIASGDFSQQANAPRSDEIGALANAFNSMSSQLRDLIGSLEQRVADRTKALATSAEISRRLSMILDQKQLVSEVVEQVNNTFGYYHTQIYFFDASNENLVLAGGTGEAGEMMMAQFHKVSKGRGLVGRAAESNQAILVADTTQNLEWLPNALLPDTKSEVAIPISIGEQVLGVLDVQQNSIGGLKQEDIDSLQSIANQAAVAYQNIQSTQIVAQRASQLQTVARISTAAATISDVQTMLETVVHLTQRGFGLYHAHVFIYDENTAQLLITACGYKEGDEHEGTHGTVAIPIAQEQSLVARAARTRQAVIVNDVRNEPGWLPNPLLPDTASELAVPMIVGEQLLGVLDVQSERLNAFTNEDATIQTTLASQIAVAAQNARSFSQSQRQAERESAVNLITQKIQGAASVEAALQIAARELGHALGMRQTLVSLDVDKMAADNLGGRK